MVATQQTPTSILNEISAYLRAVFGHGAVALTHDEHNRRMESLVNEAEIRQTLRTLSLTPNGFFREQGLTLIEPFTVIDDAIRDPIGWFDFAVEGPGVFVPVNIKVSNISGRNQDNLNCKLGLYYALTGHRPNFGNGIGFKQLMQKMAEQMSDDTDADYYFLVVNKSDPQDVFWNSLKGLSVLGPNGRNPPFQGRWADNRNHVARTTVEARRFLLGKLRESFVQAAKPLIAFDELLNTFMEQ